MYIKSILFGRPACSFATPALISALMAVLWVPRAYSDIAISLDTVAVQGTLATPTAATQSQTVYDVGVMLSTQNKSKYYLGAMFMGYSSSDKDLTGVTTTLSIQDVLLGGTVYFTRRRDLSVTLGYGVLSSALFKTGSAATETWTGTSAVVKLSFKPEISETLSAGLSISYYAGNYVKKDVSNTSTAFAGAKSFILPTISMSFNF